jgi:hypothetical protein
VAEKLRGPAGGQPAEVIHRLRFQKMGWQTTFTLKGRSKGCHLVTDEVLSRIQEGLQGVQVCLKI